MKGIASLILISMGTGRMLAPLVKIINSGGETGSDEKGVEKKGGRIVGGGQKEREERECNTLTLLPASDVHKVTLYSESG